jgi:hypothetical protein
MAPLLFSVQARYSLSSSMQEASFLGLDSEYFTPNSQAATNNISNIAPQITKASSLGRSRNGNSQVFDKNMEVSNLSHPNDYVGTSKEAYHDIAYPVLLARNPPGNQEPPPGNQEPPPGNQEPPPGNGNSNQNLLVALSLLLGGTALAGTIINLIYTARLKKNTDLGFSDLSHKLQELGLIIKTFEDTLIVAKEQISANSTELDTLKIDTLKKIDELSQDLTKRIEETRQAVLSQSQETSEINIKLLEAQANIQNAQADLVSIKARLGI